MDKKKVALYLKRIMEFLLSALITQLLMALAMIPLYSSWGIPLSLLGFFGNIIFIPFLTIFISLSTLLLFCFIVKYIPYSLIYITKIIVFFWIKIMKIFSCNGLLMVCIPHHGIINYIICWPIALFFIISSTVRQNKKILILSLFIALTSCIIMLKYIIHLPGKTITIIHSSFNKWPIVIIYKKNNNIICFEYAKQKISDKKRNVFINYTLLPYLCKTWGTIHYRYYVLHH